MDNNKCNALRNLNKGEAARLTGFTVPLVHSFAHLREAWVSADGENQRAIEAAIAVLFLKSHSALRNRSLLEEVLRESHQRGDEFIAGIVAATSELEHDISHGGA